MSDGTFPAGYIKRTIVEPIAIWMPTKKVVEEKELPRPIPSALSLVAEKVVESSPWIFVGLSLGAFLIAIGRVMRKTW